jgi:hypothetical protein
MVLFEWVVKYIDFDLETKTYCVKAEYRHHAVSSCYEMHPALRKIISVRRYYTRADWISSADSIDRPPFIYPDIIE